MLDVKAIHAWLMVDSLVVIEQVPLTPFASSPYIAITNVPTGRSFKLLFFAASSEIFSLVSDI